MNARQQHTSKQVPDQLWELAAATCDDSLDDAGVAALEPLLANDSAARRFYIDYCTLHASLGETISANRAIEGAVAAIEAEENADIVTPQLTTPHSPITAHHSLLTNWSRFATQHKLATGLAAGLLFVAALVGWAAFTYLPTVARPVAQPVAQPQHPSEEVAADKWIALLNHAHKAKWLDGTKPAPHHPRLKFGQRLAISAGLLEIKYHTGATVIVEGPAEFVVGSERGKRKAESGEATHHAPLTTHQNNSGYLAHGKLTARCDTQESKGFTIETPSSVVQDLGTEFGVFVDGTLTTALLVYRGHVSVAGRLESGELAEPIQVAQGQSLSVDRRGSASALARLTPEQYDRVAEQQRTFSVAATPQLSNGGFEDRAGASWKLLNPPGGGVEFTSGRANRLRAQGGTRFVAILDNDRIANRGISQTFATEPGTNYTLTFYLARPTLNGAPDINVDVFDGAGFGGQNLATATFKINWANNQWQQQAMKFVARSRTTTLRFQEKGTSVKVDPYIDTVEVTAN